MIVVHKRMLFLTFEGLSTTFEGLTNVYHNTNLLTLSLLVIISLIVGFSRHVECK